MSLQTQKQKIALKMIAVSEDNYFALKRLGHAGDSFNDVITQVLKRVKNKTEVVTEG
jgi:predicted CopG family antitoxin